jgi:hypothetical protein
MLPILRQEPEFARALPRREEPVEIGEFLIEGEGTLVAVGDHPCENVPVKGNMVEVFLVKLVHEAPVRVWGMLRWMSSNSQGSDAIL